MANLTSSPIGKFIEHQGICFLDGGLATELENLGNDLNHPLWSARVIRDHPMDLVSVHRSFLEAGADCIAAASYQATIPGLTADGLSTAEARDVLVKSVELACQARNDFLSSDEFTGTGRLVPAVAASVGPYGAYLADGSEYLGHYGISNEELRSFHLSRWEILAASEADLFACETIPSLQEAEVLLQIFEETPDSSGWMSFSCPDGATISDGTPIGECVRAVESCSRPVAIGINCTAPRFVLSLIERVREESDDIHIAVYPNSGELYSIATRTWTGVADPISYAEAGRKWCEKGAKIIGGCCRTSPGHINSLRRSLTGAT